jgi:hypothetical protein
MGLITPNTRFREVNRSDLVFGELSDQMGRYRHPFVRKRFGRFKEA